MNLIKVILPLLRRALMWLMAVYWVSFIWYTCKCMIAGGPRDVIVWYRHIDRHVWVGERWDWERFAAGQLALLAITLALCWFERRHPRAGAGR